MKLNKQFTWINIIYGVLIFTVGILAFVFAIVNPENVSKVVSYSVATCLFLLGLIFISSALALQTKEIFSMTLVIGSIVIALGAVLCINTDLVTSFFMYFLCILLIALGLIALIKMGLSIKYKEKKSLIVSYGLVGALVIVLGILGLVYIGPAGRFIFLGLGIVLIVIGIAEIVLGVKLLKKENKHIKTIKVEEIETKEVIDVKTK